jgi:hypothetical protein
MKDKKGNKFWRHYLDLAKHTEKAAFRTHVESVCGRKWENFKRIDSKKPLAFLEAGLFHSLCAYLEWNPQEMLTKELLESSKQK